MKKRRKLSAQARANISLGLARVLGPTRGLDPETYEKKGRKKKAHADAPDAPRRTPNPKRTTTGDDQKPLLNAAGRRDISQDIPRTPNGKRTVQRPGAKPISKAQADGWGRAPETTPEQRIDAARAMVKASNLTARMDSRKPTRKARREAAKEARQQDKNRKAQDKARRRENTQQKRAEARAGLADQIDGIKKATTDRARTAAAVTKRAAKDAAPVIKQAAKDITTDLDAQEQDRKARKRTLRGQATSAQLRDDQFLRTVDDLPAWKADADRIAADLAAGGNRADRAREEIAKNKNLYGRNERDFKKRRALVGRNLRDTDGTPTPNTDRAPQRTPDTDPDTVTRDLPENTAGVPDPRTGKRNVQRPGKPAPGTEQPQRTERPTPRPAPEQRPQRAAQTPETDPTAPLTTNVTVTGGGRQASPDYLNPEKIRTEPKYAIDAQNLADELTTPEAVAKFNRKRANARTAAQTDTGDPARNRANVRRTLRMDALAEDLHITNGETRATRPTITPDGQRNTTAAVARRATTATNRRDRMSTQQRADELNRLQGRRDTTAQPEAQDLPESSEYGTSPFAATPDTDTTTAEQPAQPEQPARPTPRQAAQQAEIIRARNRRTQAKATSDLNALRDNLREQDRRQKALAAEARQAELVRQRRAADQQATEQAPTPAPERDTTPAPEELAPDAYADMYDAEYPEAPAYDAYDRMADDMADTVDQRAQFADYTDDALAAEAESILNRWNGDMADFTPQGTTDEVNLQRLRDDRARLNSINTERNLRRDEQGTTSTRDDYDAAAFAALAQSEPDQPDDTAGINLTDADDDELADIAQTPTPAGVAARNELARRRRDTADANAKRRNPRKNSRLAAVDHRDTNADQAYDPEALEALAAAAGMDDTNARAYSLASQFRDMDDNALSTITRVGDEQAQALANLELDRRNPLRPGGAHATAAAKFTTTTRARNYANKHNMSATEQQELIDLGAAAGNRNLENASTYADDHKGWLDGIRSRLDSRGLDSLGDLDERDYNALRDMLDISEGKAKGRHKTGQDDQDAHAEELLSAMFDDIGYVPSLHNYIRAQNGQAPEGPTSVDEIREHFAEQSARLSRNASGKRGPRLTPEQKAQREHAKGRRRADTTVSDKELQRRIRDLDNGKRGDARNPQALEGEKEAYRDEAYRRGLTTTKPAGYDARKAAATRIEEQRAENRAQAAKQRAKTTEPKTEAPKPAAPKAETAKPKAPKETPKPAPKRSVTNTANAATKALDEHLAARRDKNLTPIQKAQAEKKWRDAEVAHAKDLERVYRDNGQTDKADRMADQVADKQRRANAAQRRLDQARIKQAEKKQAEAQKQLDAKRAELQAADAKAKAETAAHKAKQAARQQRAQDLNNSINDIANRKAADERTSTKAATAAIKKAQAAQAAEKKANIDRINADNQAALAKKNADAKAAKAQETEAKAEDLTTGIKRVKGRQAVAEIRTEKAIREAAAKAQAQQEQEQRDLLDSLTAELKKEQDAKKKPTLDGTSGIRRRNTPEDHYQDALEHRDRVEQMVRDAKNDMQRQAFTKTLEEADEDLANKKALAGHGDKKALARATKHRDQELDTADYFQEKADTAGRQAENAATPLVKAERESVQADHEVSATDRRARAARYNLNIERFTGDTTEERLAELHKAIANADAAHDKAKDASDKASAKVDTEKKKITDRGDKHITDALANQGNKPDHERYSHLTDQQLQDANKAAAAHGLFTELGGERGAIEEEGKRRQRRDIEGVTTDDKGRRHLTLDDHDQTTAAEIIYDRLVASDNYGPHAGDDKITVDDGNGHTLQFGTLTNRTYSAMPENGKDGAMVTGDNRDRDVKNIATALRRAGFPSKTTLAKQRKENARKAAAQADANRSDPREGNSPLGATLRRADAREAHAEVMDNPKSTPEQKAKATADLHAAEVDYAQYQVDQASKRDTTTERGKYRLETAQKALAKAKKAQADATPKPDNIKQRLQDHAKAARKAAAPKAKDTAYTQVKGKDRDAMVYRDIIQGEAMTTREVADATGLTPAQARTTLNRLERAGLVGKSSEGGTDTPDSNISGNRVRIEDNLIWSDTYRDDTPDAAEAAISDYVNGTTTPDAPKETAPEVDKKAARKAAAEQWAADHDHIESWKGGADRLNKSLRAGGRYREQALARLTEGAEADYYGGSEEVFQARRTAASAQIKKNKATADARTAEAYKAATTGDLPADATRSDLQDLKATARKALKADPADTDALAVTAKVDDALKALNRKENQERKARQKADMERRNKRRAERAAAREAERNKAADNKDDDGQDGPAGGTTATPTPTPPPVSPTVGNTPNTPKDLALNGTNGLRAGTMPDAKPKTRTTPTTTPDVTAEANAKAASNPRSRFYNPNASEPAAPGNPATEKQADEIRRLQADANDTTRALYQFTENDMTALVKREIGKHIRRNDPKVTMRQAREQISDDDARTIARNLMDSEWSDYQTMHNADPTTLTKEQASDLIGRLRDNRNGNAGHTTLRGTSTGKPRQDNDPNVPAALPEGIIPKSIIDKYTTAPATRTAAATDGVPAPEKKPDATEDKGAQYDRAQRSRTDATNTLMHRLRTGQDTDPQPLRDALHSEAKDAGMTDADADRYVDVHVTPSIDEGQKSRDRAKEKRKRERDVYKSLDGTAGLRPTPDTTGQDLTADGEPTTAKIKALAEYLATPEGRARYDTAYKRDRASELDAESATVQALLPVMTAAGVRIDDISNYAGNITRAKLRAKTPASIARNLAKAIGLDQPS